MPDTNALTDDERAELEALRAEKAKREQAQAAAAERAELEALKAEAARTKSEAEHDRAIAEARERGKKRALANGIEPGLGIAVMTLMGVLMFIFAPELMAIMSPVEQIVSEGAAALRIEAFAEPMFAAAIVCNGVFVGAGDTLKPAIMSLMSMWGVRLTLAAWLARDHGLRGVWTAMAIELTFRGIIFLVRLFKGSWNKSLRR